MELEAYRTYCLQKKGVTETFPFDEHILVHKVGGKMFALTDIRDFVRINVKCDPAEAIRLRNLYDGIKPGWHMNKKHWNTIYLAGFKNAEIYGWIDDSYNLVVAKLPKSFPW